jgi:UDP-glucose 4-epimerase
VTTALVTGCEGFLGRHLVAALNGAGWRTAGLDRLPASTQSGLAAYYSLGLPSPDFDGVIEAVRPDAILHAAGPASVGDSLADPAADFHGSVGSLFGVLEAARRLAPDCRVLFLSSAAVYGQPARLPVDESAPHRPLSPYGYHKSLCEQLLREFWSVYRLPSVTLRLFSAYGPGLRRQVLWDICRKALASSEIELFGTGDESRDFVHARDIARAALQALERAPFEAEVYNVASGQETRIRDLAEMIVRALGHEVRVRFTGQVRPGDPQRWQADLTRIRALGYAPSVPLERGVAEYVEWVLAEATS